MKMNWVSIHRFSLVCRGGNAASMREDHMPTQRGGPVGGAAVHGTQRDGQDRLLLRGRGGGAVRQQRRSAAPVARYLLFVFNFKTSKRNCNTNWVMRNAVFQLPVEETPCQSSLKELTALINREEGM